MLGYSEHEIAGMALADLVVKEKGTIGDIGRLECFKEDSNCVLLSGKIVIKSVRNFA